MSYKDLEQQIKEWANIEEFARVQKEAAQDAKRQAKREKKIRKLLGPKPAMFKPDKPLKYSYIVTLLVREKKHRVWGEEFEVSVEVVDTISQPLAEIEAARRVSEQGYHVAAITKVYRSVE